MKPGPVANAAARLARLIASDGTVVPIAATDMNLGVAVFATTA